jgi:hypothetical protein
MVTPVNDPAQLPDFTVARTESYPGMDGTVYAVPKILTKIDGAWIDNEGYPYAYTDADLWDSRPDALIVSLPTGHPLNRHQAEVLWDMKQKARTCDQGGVLEPGRNLIQ